MIEHAVAGAAIEAVQLHFGGEIRASDHAAQCGCAHLLHFHEAHVASHAGAYLFDKGIGHAQTPENRFGHTGSELGMAVEADAIARVGSGGRFGDVVQEHGVGKGGGTQGHIIEHHQRMGENITFGVEFRRLLLMLEIRHLREKGAQQAQCFERPDGLAGALRFHENPREFIADAFGADVSEPGCFGADCGGGVGIELEVEAMRKAHGAQHAEVILLKAQVGISDAADDSRLQIVLALDKIMERLGDGVPEHRVDGEVAPLGIFFCGRKCDGIGMASVGIALIDPERGHFEEAAILFGDNDAEVPSDGIGVWKNVQDLIGGGCGGNVVIIGCALQELIAHTSAGPIGFVAGLLEALDKGRGGGLQVLLLLGIRLRAG